MTYDFNPPRMTGPRQRPRMTRPGWWLLAAALVCIGLFWLLGIPGRPTEDDPTAPAAVAMVPATPTPLEAPVPPPTPQPVRQEIAGVVKAGDTITGLLGDWFNPQAIYQLREQSLKVFPLRQLCAGQPYRICTVDNQFDSFTYDIDKNEQFIVHRDGDGFSLERVAIPYTVHTDLVRGTIRSSLFEAVTDIGEGPELAMELAEIFAWDIDFIRDLRQGDSFQLLVEKRFRDGGFANYGRILAAEFINNGETYRAALFEDGNRPADYYDPDGRSLRKAFLKAPLKFSRISSGFNRHRKNPVTGDYSPHLAIDYPAPVGTPVKSIGDGTVTTRGFDRLSGNKVRIRHPNNIETLYIHLSKFGSGVAVGKKVRQGQIIGYVGTTGRSTGPHLHFGIIKNGQAINPLKLKSPPAQPVSSAFLPAFQALAQERFSRFRAPVSAEAPELKQAPLPTPPAHEG